MHRAKQKKKKSGPGVEPATIDYIVLSLGLETCHVTNIR